VQPLTVSEQPAPNSPIHPAELAPVERKPCHYIYVGAGVPNGEDLVKLLRYVAQTQPQVGTNLEEAMKADRVIMIGAPTAVNEAVERQLRALGIPVERFAINQRE